jgi:hypothetical protein
MVFNATFNNISVISLLSVLLVEETQVPGGNYWPAASHWQTDFDPKDETFNKKKGCLRNRKCVKAVLESLWRKMSNLQMKIIHMSQYKGLFINKWLKTKTLIDITNMTLYFISYWVNLVSVVSEEV